MQDQFGSGQPSRKRNDLYQDEPQALSSGVMFPREISLPGKNDPRKHTKRNSLFLRAFRVISWIVLLQA